MKKNKGSILLSVLLITALAGIVISLKLSDNGIFNRNSNTEKRKSPYDDAIANEIALIEQIDRENSQIHNE